MGPKAHRATRFYLDVAAAYNCEELPLLTYGSPQVQSIEELLAHPFYWTYMSEHDTEEVLMELYMVRRRRAQ
jgi:hypothetical protein